MRHAAKLLVASLFFVSPRLANAGAIPPCVTGASSTNKSFLVLTDIQTTDISPQLKKVQQISFRVVAEETLVRANYKVALPVTYWSWSPWTVVLKSDAADWAFTSFCPLPLITGDGEVLVLLSTGAGYLAGPALRIYRRRDHPGDPMRPGPDHGVLIRDISLKELWPADKDSNYTYSSDNDMSEWYAGGQFEFSPNQGELIHRTRWGSTVYINLHNGSVQQVSCTTLLTCLTPANFSMPR
jgi:hypothetical protein